MPPPACLLSVTLCLFSHHPLPLRRFGGVLRANKKGLVVRTFTAAGKGKRARTSVRAATIKYILAGLKAKSPSTMRKGSAKTATSGRFTAGTVRSRIGRFKTAPATSSSPAALNFAVLTCQDWSVNHWAAMNLLAAEVVDHDVRARAAAGLGIDHLVPEAVARYIDQHHLYLAP